MDIYHKEQSIFPLTWLMVKRHKVTGLLYFCKTTRTNPYKYNGSGKYWCRHLKIYGKTIETIWCQSFDDRDDLIEFATFFSEVFDIVNSKDINGNKLWANLEVENGITGMPPGTDRGVLFKEKAKVYNKGTKNPSYGSKWWNNGNIEIRCKMKPEGEEWCQGRIGLKEKINKTKILNNTVPVGSKNPRYDHRIHTFYNTMSGLELQCTQYEFRKKLNLERKNVNGLVNGSKKIYLGWIIKN